MYIFVSREDWYKPRDKYPNVEKHVLIREDLDYFIRMDKPFEEIYIYICISIYMCEVRDICSSFDGAVICIFSICE